MKKIMLYAMVCAIYSAMYFIVQVVLAGKFHEEIDTVMVFFMGYSIAKIDGLK